MSEKKALTREVCARYRRASRREKTAMLDEFVKTTGYNRKYAVRMLGKMFKEIVISVDGQSVNVKTLKPGGKRKSARKGKPVYGPEVISRLHVIWEFFWYKCGKYLAPLIREQMPFLESGREPDFRITPEIKCKLLAISPASIDRALKPYKAVLRGKGISGTRLGETSLLRQIPIRTHYNNIERCTPGYFQTDTVHHCGNSDSGEFNLTLSVTDVSSGWTELRPLLNKAHKWTLEALQNVYGSLLFPMIELHSDNGGEFINHDTINWRNVTETLALSRSRAHHKNDNCFAEQKNNAFVRNYVGYSRFDTDAEYAALACVYESLCPLLNFFIPNKKLISKTTVGSKTVKKYDSPKTSYQRLMESSFLSAQVKNNLAKKRLLLNPVVLQYTVHRAVNTLLAIHRAKVTFLK